MAVKDYQFPTRALGYIVVGALIFQCVATHQQKINWFNPCKYNRTSRDIRTRSLALQLKIATNEYRKEINSTIEEIYSNNPHIPCEKFLVKGKNDMLRYYAKFYVLGVKIEKMLRSEVKSSDYSFQFEERKRLLTRVRDRTKTIMCEMYDVLRHRKNFDKRKIRRELKSHRTRLATNIKSAGLTNITIIDNCLYSTYKRLIFSLYKRIKEKKKINGHARQHKNYVHNKL